MYVFLDIVHLLPLLIFGLISVVIQSYCGVGQESKKYYETLAFVFM